MFRSQSIKVGTRVAFQSILNGNLHGLNPIILLALLLEYRSYVFAIEAGDGARNIFLR